MELQPHVPTAHASQKQSWMLQAGASVCGAGGGALLACFLQSLVGSSCPSPPPRWKRPKGFLLTQDPTCLRGLTSSHIIQIWRTVSLEAVLHGRCYPGPAWTAPSWVLSHCTQATPCGESYKYLNPVGAQGHSGHYSGPASDVPKSSRLSHPQPAGPQPGNRLLIQTHRAYSAALGTLT